jgi:hypothetical protein
MPSHTFTVTVNTPDYDSTQEAVSALSELLEDSSKLVAENLSALISPSKIHITVEKDPVMI